MLARITSLARGIVSPLCDGTDKYKRIEELEEKPRFYEEKLAAKFFRADAALASYIPADLQLRRLK